MTAVAIEPVSALRCAGLRKDFGGVHAVVDLGFSVERGAILGIIGPNGSGKTTLLNLVSGVIAADAGSVWLSGRDVTAMKTYEHARSGLARTFQNLRLFRNLSVLENLLIGGHVGPRHRSSGRRARLLPLRAERELRDRALALLRDLGLEAEAQRMAGTLAYGLQRRVEIGRSLMSSPAVLLLDEPVAGMNDAEAGSVRDLLEVVRSQGVAQVVIEHNVAFVTDLVDDLLVMVAGQVLAAGRPDEVIRDDRVIKAYLG